MHSIPSFAAQPCKFSSVSTQLSYLLISISLFFGSCFSSRLFTARRYAKHGICCRRVFVCVCVWLTHSSIVSKRLNVGSCK